MKKLDRLSSLVAHFEIKTAVRESFDSANLVIFGEEDQPRKLIFQSRSTIKLAAENALAAIEIDFGGQANPVFGALPDNIHIELNEAPEINAIAELILAEVSSSRCGSQIALDRLCEFLIIKILRIQIGEKTSKTGVFAGLANPNLCPTLVAIHDNPEQDWKLDDFVEMSGMCRTGFIETFNNIVGSTPMAYLKNWRLTMARNEIRNGKRVKETAARYGYGSGDAFTRAFTNVYGVSPTKFANDITSTDTQLS